MQELLIKIKTIYIFFLQLPAPYFDSARTSAML